jgi:hypothetical protein
VPTIKVFTVRYSFLCPVCHNIEDGELIIGAKTSEDAMRQVRARRLICDFCSAEIPANISTVEIEAA